MPNLVSVTNTFTANTKAKSSEVNTNFTDLVTGHTSFTKDIKVGTTYLQTSAKSADYTVTDTDGIRTILMTTGASDRTVTLPTAADNSGRILTIKKVDSGAGKVTIDGEGAETVDGDANFILYLDNESVTVHCDGTEWHILGMRGAEGTYTPTFGNYSGQVTTVDTPGIFHYRRNNKVVEVWGNALIDQTAAGAGSFTISLPIASNFTNEGDVGGVSGISGTSANAYPSGFILADTTNDLAKVFINCESTSDNRTVSISFKYKIL